MNKYPEEEIKEYERQLRLSKDKTKQNQGNRVEQTVKIQNTGSNSIADELLKYKSLLESGAITVEEYEDIKKKLLNGVG